MSSHCEKHSDSCSQCRRTGRAWWRSEAGSFPWSLTNSFRHSFRDSGMGRGFCSQGFLRSYQDPGHGLAHFRWWRGKNNPSRWGLFHEDTLGPGCSGCVWLSRDWRQTPHCLCQAGLENPFGLDLQLCRLDLQDNQKQSVIEGRRHLWTDYIMTNLVVQRFPCLLCGQ